MKKQRRGLDRYNVLHDGWRCDSALKPGLLVLSKCLLHHYRKRMSFGKVRLFIAAVFISTLSSSSTSLLFSVFLEIISDFIYKKKTVLYTHIFL